jgi:8-oxo-dGTP pyrophosphatase MutT (NUDIX family)
MDWDSERDHGKALQQTGFWGAQGAGCIIAAEDTKRILLPYRSDSVEQPHTWGTWGGAIDRGLNPEEAARLEVQQEAGVTIQSRLIPLYVFTKGTFRYSNFLAIVPNEFNPRLNWETEAFRWVRFGEWPSPLHFGLKALLSDQASIAKIEAALQ